MRAMRRVLITINRDRLRGIELSSDEINRDEKRKSEASSFAVLRLPSRSAECGAHSNGGSVGGHDLSPYNHVLQLPHRIVKAWS